MTASPDLTLHGPTTHASPRLLEKACRAALAALLLALVTGAWLAFFSCSFRSSSRRRRFH